MFLKFMILCWSLLFMFCFFFLFFFFKQKTAYELRISDWSSDVCSSDLPLPRRPSRFAEGSCDPFAQGGRVSDHRNEGQDHPSPARRPASRKGAGGFAAPRDSRDTGPPRGYGAGGHRRRNLLPLARPVALLPRRSRGGSGVGAALQRLDRKSTRLNSRH